MPNGKYDPQCYNCQFVTHRQDRRSCKLHDFVMPDIDTEIICRDFQLAEELQGDSVHFGYVPRFMHSQEFRTLEPGSLYYSFDRYGKFGAFRNLQRLIIDGDVYNDEELGWVIYLRHNRTQYPFLPEPKTRFRVLLNGDTYDFEIADLERRRLMGGRREEDGRWINNWQTVTTRIVYCPSKPNVLYDWLDHYFDARTLVEHLTDPSKTRFPEIESELWISCFVEIIEEKTVYRLRPDSLYHSEHARKGTLTVV